jgi:hypothetical protein
VNANVYDRVGASYFGNAVVLLPWTAVTHYRYLAGISACMRSRWFSDQHGQPFCFVQIRSQSICVNFYFYLGEALFAAAHSFLKIICSDTINIFSGKKFLTGMEPANYGNTA